MSGHSFAAVSATAMSANHPVLAVPGDDGGRCKLPVGYRPISCRSALLFPTLKAAGPQSPQFGPFPVTMADAASCQSATAPTLVVYRARCVARNRSHM